MKRKSSFLFLAVLLLMGCARPKQEASIIKPLVLAPLPMSQSIALSWQKPVATGSLTVTLQRLEDSRCPKDVLCIWAGIAVADVQLQDSAGASLSKTLSLGYPVNVSLGDKTYQLTLREITPYPMLSNLPLLEKEARISVATL